MEEQTDQAATSTEALPTVFFSYSREDRDKAIPLIAAIQSAGFSVWYDGMLEPGEQYLEKTEAILNSAKAVVVLWSPRSIQSNWVRDEAMVGRERSCLVPLSIEGAMPPLGFRQFQSTDVSSWTGSTDAQEIRALIRQLSLLHGQPAPPRADFISTPTNVPAKINRRWALGLGAATMILGGGLIGRNMLPRSDSAQASDNSVVVLSFSNLSGDADYDYIPLGVSAELRGALMRNAALRVVAKRTSDAIQSKDLDATTIAQELGVSFILDGNLSAIDGVLNLSLELIDGITGFSRWAQTFTADRDQLLPQQETMLTQILRTITEDLGEHDPRDIGAPSNPSAFDQYLRGLDAWRLAATPDDARAALIYFDEAVRLDSGFAAAHALRGSILSWVSSATADPQDSAQLLDEAKFAARKAVALGPDLPVAHSTLGWVEFFAAIDIEAAAAPFERARELGKGNASILGSYAMYAALSGEPEAAKDAIERAIRLDPISPYMHNTQAIVRYYAGEYELARKSAEAALAIDQNVGIVRFWAGLSQIQSGDSEAAIETCELEPNTDAKYTCQAIALARLGRDNDAIDYLDKLTEAYGDGASFQRAQILAQLGDHDGAMAALERAWNTRDAGLIAAYAEPMLDPLRAREDFSRLLSEIGFDSV